MSIKLFFAKFIKFYPISAFPSTTVKPFLQNAHKNVLKETRKGVNNRETMSRKRQKGSVKLLQSC